MRGFRRRAALVAAALPLFAACAQRLGPEPVSPPPPYEPVRVETPLPQRPEPLGVPVPSRAIQPLALVDFDAFDMPVHVNEHVLEYIAIFTGRARPRFEQWLQRQGRFSDLIESRIRERGMPRELLYLALIESGYSPVAVSHANAVGLWQFIASTGRLEGLRIDADLDERRDPVRATEAALQHLQKLYDRFGSWYLAAAAYNAGAGRIERALAVGVQGARGHDSIFWQIRDLLPLETRNYVPQLLAATIIGTHRHLFGFTPDLADPPLEFEAVEIADATELAVLAEAAGLDSALLASLNAHLVRGITPARERTLVRVPAGFGENVRVAYAAIPPDARIRTRVHTVAPGETLSGIAARFGTTVRALQAANGIVHPDRLRVGQRLLVAVPGRTTSARAVDSDHR